MRAVYKNKAKKNKHIKTQYHIIVDFVGSHTHPHTYTFFAGHKNAMKLGCNSWGYALNLAFYFWTPGKE